MPARAADAGDRQGFGRARRRCASASSRPKARPADRRPHAASGAAAARSCRLPRRRAGGGGWRSCRCGRPRRRRRRARRGAAPPPSPRGYRDRARPRRGSGGSGRARRRRGRARTDRAGRTPTACWHRPAERAAMPATNRVAAASSAIAQDAPAISCSPRAGEAAIGQPPVDRLDPERQHGTRRIMRRGGDRAHLLAQRGQAVGSGGRGRGHGLDDSFVPLMFPTCAGSASSDLR